MTAKYVVYLRVSTGSQAASGLGLEAQADAINRHLQSACSQAAGVGKLPVAACRQAASGLERVGKLPEAACEQAAQHRFPSAVIAQYTEVESGKRADNRPELQKALAHCKATGATLIVAKLDRLGRQVSFLSALMESGVEFVACDNPHANKLTIHILAAMAEHEREMISERTKAALAAAKDRGTALGNPDKGAALKNWTLANGNGAATEGAAQAADSYAKEMAFLLDRAREIGHTTASAIARHLNAEGIPSRRGGKWTTTTVGRLMSRIEAVAT